MCKSGCWFSRFNTRTEQWERVSGMQHARSALNMVALDGKLYALGKQTRERERERERERKE